MLYALDQDELTRLREASASPEFTGAQMLLARFRTDPEFVRTVLPSGLRPTEEAAGAAFVARYPETNFGSRYNEGAVFVECERRGEVGMYCLAMPVDDDIAMIGGREFFGYPKKMAERITLDISRNAAVGSVVRRGTEILRIEATLGRALGVQQMDAIGSLTTDENGRPARQVISFLYKFFPGPDGNSFDYIPRLVRQPNIFRPREGVRAATGTVQLGSSGRDPLGEMPVGEITSMLYGEFDNTMMPGKVVGRAWNLPRFLRHAFFKTDMAPFRLGYDTETAAAPVVREDRRAG